MDMSIEHKKLIEKAKTYLKELVSNADEITFEEFGMTLGVENPPNAAVVIFSYKEPTTKDKSPVHALFSKKYKGVYLEPTTGEFLAVRNKLI